MISNFCGIEFIANPPPNPTSVHETLKALVSCSIVPISWSSSSKQATEKCTYRNGINTSSLLYIEVLQGRDGRDSRDGIPGPHGPQGQKGEQEVAGPPGPRNGGVVYTRWGKTSCPNISGTELVYAGRAGVSTMGRTTSSC